ncbi:MAG: 23S rRNA (pseudouridine(1915)-N(3))-methyltransferase RlmH [Clostridiales bacterium]|jgi:23S rRNA (pseudouridine1915-N3)-methyltransferase|nr:23S rRNA (pseudouridine(1915)-N(3))-methyltransferase RlmH [Clostridiales bacterium]
MVRIRIVAVGKIKEKYISDAIGEYQKRLGRFCRLEIAEAGEARNLREDVPAMVERQLLEEAEGIRRRLAGGGFVIAADAGGEALDSAQFAARLRLAMERASGVTFVIGGSNGLHRDIKRLADCTLSMSRMTFPHQMARLILVEQIYRAFKIIGNESYHK